MDSIPALLCWQGRYFVKNDQVYKINQPILLFFFSTHKYRRY